MAFVDDLKARAMRIPTQSWFRAVAPKVIPPLHRAMARVSGGKWHPGAAIILTTTGSRSGEERKTPLEMIPRDDGSYLVVASNFAGENHPAWSYNLIANTEASVLHHGEEHPVTAILLDGEARAAAWQEAVAHWPQWQTYTELTDRRFRIFNLVPRG